MLRSSASSLRPNTRALSVRRCTTTSRATTTTRPPPDDPIQNERRHWRYLLCVCRLFVQTTVRDRAGAENRLTMLEEVDDLVVAYPLSHAFPPSLSGLATGWYNILTNAMGFPIGIEVRAASIGPCSLVSPRGQSRRTATSTRCRCMVARLHHRVPRVEPKPSQTYLKFFYTAPVI